MRVKTNIKKIKKISEFITKKSIHYDYRKEKGGTSKDDKGK